MGSIPAIKHKIRAKAYIANGLNATATILAEKPTMGKEVAKVAGSRMVANANFQKALLDEMEAQGLSDRLVIQAHRENIEQSENLPARNTAIDMYYKVKRVYEDSSEKHLHLHTTPDSIASRLAELEQELKRINPE